MTPQKTVAWRWDAKPTPGNTGGVEYTPFSG
jgi:hypothetical protein